MKILEPDKELELRTRIKLRNKENENFNAERTSFWWSLLFLIIEAVLPILGLWLISSPDIHFRLFSIKWYEGLGVTFIALFICTILTLTTFMFNFHKIDQFTFNYGLFGIGMSFYLSAYWFGVAHFLYQSLIAFAFFLIFLLFGTMLGVVVKNIKLKYLNKKAETTKNAN